MPIARSLFALAAAALLSAPAAFAQTPRATGGIPITAPHAMVVSNSDLATAAGVEILKAGGNAVDAAVAVGFALAVTYPEAGNLGGGGFMVIRMADGRSASLDYREMAPRGATREMFMDSASRASKASQEGARASGVPGSVAGMLTAHLEFGRLPLARVMAPAIRLAEKGFVVDTAFEHSLTGEARLIGKGAGAKVFLPNGEPLRAGQKLVQPALARTLKAIAARGKRGFYEGEVAKAIADEQQRDGGLITLEDLREYHPAWREPLTGTYRGWTILSMPPSSSGGITMIETLNILEHFAPLPPARGAAQTHLLAEALRRAFVDRNALLGDPDFAPLPVLRLTSKPYARAQAATIPPNFASPTETVERALPSADRRAPAAESRAPSAEPGPPTPEPVNTTHYSVVDPKGNAVSTTTTLNDLFGSGVYVAAAGFFLNDEMDDFSTNPGQPNGYGLVQGERNAVAPGKRMLSAMAPTIVLDSAGTVALVLGGRGGPRIITSMVQVLLGVMEYGQSLPDAVFAPRIHEQARPDTLKYEEGALDPAVVGTLVMMGYAPAVSNFQPGGYIGRIFAIGRVKDGWVGVVDRRTSGGAAGY